ncbi:MAG: (d)CMP kinase, partial [Chloroflexi bacterium]|nr:(d)CMP kinase [Chloroflexota bacterium]
MARPSIIAIDGPVAAGKSAIGSLLAQKLGYRFLDTGVMYRALTWTALERRVNMEDEMALSQLAEEVKICLQPEGGSLSYSVFIDSKDVTAEIRQEKVEAQVSLVSRVAGVRRAMVAQQQAMAQGGKLVMAGRDIGTVVLPQADLKIYLVASAEERARRRHRELEARGENAHYQDILAEVKRRDKMDSERSISPLRPAA